MTELQWAAKSVESYHDNIHGLVRSGIARFAGHMSDPTVAFVSAEVSMTVTRAADEF